MLFFFRKFSMTKVNFSCFFFFLFLFPRVKCYGYRLRLRSRLYVHKWFWSRLLWILHPIKSMRNFGKKCDQRKIAWKSNGNYDPKKYIYSVIFFIFQWHCSYQCIGHQRWTEWCVCVDVWFSYWVHTIRAVWLIVDTYITHYSASSLFLHMCFLLFPFLSLSFAFLLRSIGLVMEILL